MNIVAPYSSDELDKKHEYSKVDHVERGGYIPNDKKIEEFISSGLALVQMRRGAGEYEIPEEESDFEEDSPEYLEELERQAEEYKEPPLMQHIDKMTAEEVLESADKALKQAELDEVEKKHQPKSKDANTRLVEALERNSKALERVTNKAESEPK